MPHNLIKLLLVSAFILAGSTVYSQSAIITTKSGKTTKCKITDSDSLNIYFTTKVNGKYVDSFIKKENVEEVTIVGNAKKENVPLESSHTNFGIGFGPSYGVLGIQTVIGKNNSGVLLGIGITPKGNPAPAVGAQASFKWFFMNVGFGVLHEVSINNGSFETQMGPFLNFGGMINLGKMRRNYIQLGLGLSLQDPDYPISSGSVETFSYRGSIGYGYRFGK